MKFNSEDKINKEGNIIKHESAGGFVFYEDPSTHKLFVALIKPSGKEELFIPKGHLKKDETSLEASEREIIEELSLSEKPDFISELGIDEYTFTLDDSGVVHHKKVYLNIYQVKTMEDIKPPKEEAIDEAMWIEFYEAAEKIAYDKDNLLKARQLFYSKKKS